MASPRGLFLALGRMKQSAASNLAIAFALLAWPLVIFGILSQLGDYPSSTAHQVIIANHRISIAVLSAGFLSYIGALWLSGFSFTGAKIRSLVAAACCAALILFGVISLWL